MKIGGYILSDTEENKVREIYTKLKEHFPDLKIKQKTSIIGIGESNRYFMCYFNIVDSAVQVKFKYQSWLSIYDDAAISRDIETVIDLFNDPNLMNKGHHQAENYAMKFDDAQSIEKMNYINDNSSKISISFEDLSVDMPSDHEIYSNLLADITDNLHAIASLRLNERECRILLSRLIGHNPPPTLQTIGDAHSLSRERTRQIIDKSIKRIVSMRIKNVEMLDLIYQKACIISHIKETSPADFLSYLFYEDINIHLIDFVCQYYLKCKVDVSNFKSRLDSARFIIEKEKIKLDKSAKYNENIYDLITFPNGRRQITEDDFDRLKYVRPVNAETKNLEIFRYGDSDYQYESDLQRRVLYKLLKYNTFKRIKTQSLRIPLKNSFFCPDFQCLTHDGRFVLIDIKPIFRMGERGSIEKFEALREYCKRYGFGYLIMDDRGNFFEHVNWEIEK